MTAKGACVGKAKELGDDFDEGEALGQRGRRGQSKRIFLQARPI